MTRLISYALTRRFTTLYQAFVFAATAILSFGCNRNDAEPPQNPSSSNVSNASSLPDAPSRDSSDAPSELCPFRVEIWPTRPVFGDQIYVKLDYRNDGAEPTYAHDVRFFPSYPLPSLIASEYLALEFEFEEAGRLVAEPIEAPKGFASLLLGRGERQTIAPGAVGTPTLFAFAPNEGYSAFPKRLAGKLSRGETVRCRLKVTWSDVGPAAKNATRRRSLSATSDFFEIAPRSAPEVAYLRGELKRLYEDWTASAERVRETCERVAERWPTASTQTDVKVYELYVAGRAVQNSSSDRAEAERAWRAFFEYIDGLPEIPREYYFRTYYGLQPDVGNSSDILRRRAFEPLGRNG
ncbi:MAG: hypothetical protein IKU86_12730 [Thermoguttaceae bacterium]|nr:hypothetical protein [Thermoguttaceae bacterium]